MPSSPNARHAFLMPLLALLGALAMSGGTIAAPPQPRGQAGLVHRVSHLGKSAGWQPVEELVPGKEYVLYQPVTGSFRVKPESGKLAIEWIDPETGKATAVDPVHSEGEVTFESPFGGGAVLHLRAQSGQRGTRACLIGRISSITRIHRVTNTP